MELEIAAHKAIALDNRLAALDAERRVLVAAKNEAIRDWCKANGYFAGLSDDKALATMRRGLSDDNLQ